MNVRYETRGSEDKGHGLFLRQAVLPGEVIVTELPLVGVQHAASREEAMCCRKCFCFVGTLDAQLRKWAHHVTKPLAILDGPGPLLPEIEGFITAPPPVPCRKGCDAMFCSPECEASAWHTWHQHLCPSAVQGLPSVARKEFIHLADVVNDKLLVGAQVLASIASKALSLQGSGLDEEAAAREAWRPWEGRCRVPWHQVVVPVGWDPSQPASTKGGKNRLQVSMGPGLRPDMPLAAEPLSWVAGVPGAGRRARHQLASPGAGSHARGSAGMASALSCMMGPPLMRPLCPSMRPLCPCPYRPARTYSATPPGAKCWACCR